MSEESKKQIEELTEEMTEFYNSCRTVSSRPLSPGEITEDFVNSLMIIINSPDHHGDGKKQFTIQKFTKTKFITFQFNCDYFITHTNLQNIVI